MGNSSKPAILQAHGTMLKLLIMNFLHWSRQTLSDAACILYTYLRIKIYYLTKSVISGILITERGKG